MAFKSLGSMQYAEQNIQLWIRYVTFGSRDTQPVQSSGYVLQFHTSVECNISFLTQFAEDLGFYLDKAKKAHVYPILL